MELMFHHSVIQVLISSRTLIARRIRSKLITSLLRLTAIQMIRNAVQTARR